MPQPVGTVIKAMDLLDALAKEGPVGVMELSRRLAIDKSAVSRLLSTLKSRQYVRACDDGRYDLGLQLFHIGQRLQNRMPFRQLIIPFVKALAAETGETAYAVHESHGQIAYLYDAVSTQEVRLGERTGLRCAHWDDIAGKAILACREEQSVLDALQAAWKIDRRGLPARNKLCHELARIRQQGYAVEREGEKCLVAAPLLRLHGLVTAAFVVGGPSYRISASKAKQLSQAVVRYAAKASITIGWTI